MSMRAFPGIQTKRLESRVKYECQPREKRDIMIDFKSLMSCTRPEALDWFPTVQVPNFPKHRTHFMTKSICATSKLERQHEACALNTENGKFLGPSDIL